MTIVKTYARLLVDDLDRALPLLTELVGAEPDLRFGFGDLELATIGDFLVIAGPTAAVAALPQATATVVVPDLAAVATSIRAHGGEITQGPDESLTGSYLYARHADGARVEYVQWNAQTTEQVLGRG